MPPEMRSLVAWRLDFSMETERERPSETSTSANSAPASVATSTARLARSNRSAMG